MDGQYTVCEQGTERTFTISPLLWEKNCADKQLLLRCLAVPLQENEKTLWLAVDDPNNLNALELFTFMTHKQVEPILIASEELKYLLNGLSPETNAIYEHHDVSYTYTANDSTTLDTHDPVIQLLEGLFKFCLAKNASDIHIEPQNARLQIRLRIDGVLHVYKTLSTHFSSRLISRIKLLAKLDISESRLPQDGQFTFTTTLSETLDFRVSTLPTAHGEKVVLRLQKNKPTHFDFLALGFTSEQKDKLIQALKQPQGLILVTGPTGSGKSITLYSALQYLNQTDKHILTAEDPIEIEIEGLIQTQVNPAIDLDFSRLLRTFLRQDPDIIMLGEIRDEESAKIALRAAQTGHLVLSTLHTNDALSAVERLNQLGIHDYEIENSLLLVIAQRLVRKVCIQCQGQGCEQCYQGYKGRVGVYQCLTKTAKNFSKQTACLDFESLLASAKQKIEEKHTDLAEVERVFGYV